jgi:TfoX/Sxy family transcriptional regulator of competence genes
MNIGRCHWHLFGVKSRRRFHSGARERLARYRTSSVCAIYTAKREEQRVRIYALNRARDKEFWDTTSSLSGVGEEISTHHLREGNQLLGYAYAN